MSDLLRLIGLLLFVIGVSLYAQPFHDISRHNTTLEEDMRLTHGGDDWLPECLRQRPRHTTVVQGVTFEDLTMTDDAPEYPRIPTKETR